MKDIVQEAKRKTSIVAMIIVVIVLDDTRDWPWRWSRIILFDATFTNTNKVRGTKKQQPSTVI